MWPLRLTPACLPRRLRRAGPRIFIGKLSKDTSENDVKDYFSRFGYVMDVYLPKAKVRGPGCAGGWGVLGSSAVPGRQRAAGASLQPCAAAAAVSCTPQLLLTLPRPPLLPQDNKSEHRGFGFVTFETDAAISRVMSAGSHRLKWVPAAPAPRPALPALQPLGCCTPPAPVVAVLRLLPRPRHMGTG